MGKTELLRRSKMPINPESSRALHDPNNRTVAVSGRPNEPEEHIAASAGSWHCPVDLGPLLSLKGTDRIIRICCPADTATRYVCTNCYAHHCVGDSHAALLVGGVGHRLIQRVQSHGGRVSSECRGAAALDGLDLLDGPGGPAEAGREVVTVEEEAVGRLDRGQGSTRGTTDAALGGASPGLLERAVLLGALAVLGEGVVRAGREVGGEGAAGAGRVSPGVVVDGSCCVRGQLEVLYQGRRPRGPVACACCGLGGDMTYLGWSAFQ